MKFFIIFLAVVAFTYADFSDEDKKKWQSFKLEHGKLFLSPGKEKDRMKTFLKNAAEIEAHNEAFLNGEVTYVKGVNKYSDLTDEAFIEKFGGIDMPADARASEPSTVTVRGTYPASLDLSKSMGTWPIRDQGQCGSCWSFSTNAAVEYGYWKKNAYSGDLSEQQLVDCVYGTAGGCSGGWMPTAFDYISKNGGVAWENQYTYTGVSGTCKKPSSTSVWLKNPGSYTQVKSDDDSIKTALSTNGVLSVCVDAGEWGSYQGGVFTSPKAASPSCTHAVALVGYGTDNGNPYWIIRNSWNTWWGEKGYMRASAKRDASGNVLGGVMLTHAYYPQMY